LPSIFSIGADGDGAGQDLLEDLPRLGLGLSRDRAVGRALRLGQRSRPRLPRLDQGCYLRLLGAEVALDAF
jgi:hypothetical protein